LTACSACSRRDAAEVKRTITVHRPGGHAPHSGRVEQNGAPTPNGVLARVGRADGHCMILIIEIRMYAAPGGPVK
jgi:hypothetical protein